MIKVKDIITLSDGNKYGVVSKTNLNDINYYYLIDINNYHNIKFLFEEKELSLVEVIDKELLKKLVSIFASNMRKELKNISN